MYKQLIIVSDFNIDTNLLNDFDFLITPILFDTRSVLEKGLKSLP